MATTLSLRGQKQALRKSVSAIMKSLSSASIEEQSRAVASRVLSLPAFQRSQTISCYLSMPSGELDTTILVSEIMKCGKTLFVPKIESSKNGHMDFLRVYGPNDLITFPSGLWGIREPGFQWLGAPRENALSPSADSLDIILVPGVAFDRSLSRLGHGKGYYDRFIASYSSTGRPKPLLVALALREQVLENVVPVGDHDWSMDLIVTPDEVFSNPREK